MTGRYVIQFHSGFGKTHYDFMLEVGQALATWQLLDNPLRLLPGQEMSGRKLTDHRLAYLSYEGPVSGNRGEVEIFASGNF